ncbi:MAG: ankyrin 2,3/unc44 [Actinomycetia bacterium]|nr:ankyrin 2,3/unc44 [Actinomycetes bacterium]
MAADEDALIAAALGAGDDDYAAAVAALVEHGGRRVEVAAVVLCEDPAPPARMLGIDLLVGLTWTDRHGMINRAVPAIEGLIGREPDVRVLCAGIAAAGNIFDPRLLAPVLRQVGHPAPDVRQQVAMTVPFLDPQADGRDRVVTALFALMRDGDPAVRDWSTMALGSLMDADSPEIRAALFERLEDDNPDARAEARAGLARRHDPRASGLVRDALLRGDVGEIDVKSAGWLADPGLVDSLIRLRARDAGWEEELEIAIERCDPERQAQVVTEGRALLERADRMLPGADVRISQELLDPEDVHLEAGPDGVLHWSYLDFIRVQAHDVEAAVHAIVREMEALAD